MRSNVVSSPQCKAWTHYTKQMWRHYWNYCDNWNESNKFLQGTVCTIVRTYVHCIYVFVYAGNIMTLSYSVGLTSGSAVAYLLNACLGPHSSRDPCLASNWTSGAAEAMVNATYFDPLFNLPPSDIFPAWGSRSKPKEYTTEFNVNWRLRSSAVSSYNWAAPLAATCFSFRCPF